MIDTIITMPKKLILPDEEIESLYLKGKSSRDIARIFGVNHSTIRKRLMERGGLRSPIEANLMRFHHRTSYLIPDDEIRRLYLEGNSPSKIASLAGVTPSSVRAKLRKWGIIRSKQEGLLLCLSRGEARRVSGANHYRWKGGEYREHGYVYVSIGKSKHRNRSHIVWEQTHGQPLPKGWVIHHLNGIKDDDRPENLLAMPKNKHDRITLGIDLMEELRKRIRELETKLCSTKNTDQDFSEK